HESLADGGISDYFFPYTALSGGVDLSLSRIQECCINFHIFSSRQGRHFLLFSRSGSGRLQFV
ncbi:hypothetical protein, partial [Cohnella thermotolerans]|uniref:hypothetical protein n=1 Tax=Cohnella thermotolerans TaxID=329858 RepID=UPI001969C930